MQEPQESWVQSLGQEDPLEKEMVTYSSILTWEIAWTEEPDGLQSTRSQRVEHDWARTHYTNYKKVNPFPNLKCIAELWQPLRLCILLTSWDYNC